MNERNITIIARYTAGETLKEIAASYGLSCQTIRGIVRRAGVFRRQTPRPEFLGVDVTTDTKAALKAEAERRGVSVSRLTSDTLEQMLTTPTAGVDCEACEAGYRLAPDGLHYNDARGGGTWGVCRKLTPKQHAGEQS